jgi:hypothetical protein
LQRYRERGCELSGSSAPGHSAAAAGGGPSAAPTACMVSLLCSTAARGSTHHNPSYKSPDLFSYPTFTHVRLRQESHPPNLPTGNPVRCDSMSAVPPSSLTPMGACAPKVPYLHAKRDGETRATTIRNEAERKQNAPQSSASSWGKGHPLPNLRRKLWPHTTLFLPNRALLEAMH